MDDFFETVQEVAFEVILFRERNKSSVMSPKPLQVNFEKRKRELFEAALKRPAPERETFISRQTQHDPLLAEAVIRLLQARQVEHGGLLDKPLYQRHALASPLMPKTIADFAVVRQLGSGGMGSVYACQRPSSSEIVAIKIIRSDLDAERARRHFERERALLTILSHPNICRFLNGGVREDGSPFIVMEFIEGEAIDKYCARRNLGVKERLLLFSQVLAGAEYCHRQQVIHRDLKPSNILVTANGSVKILDFGIAKLIDHEPGGTGHGPTRTSDRLMTVRYASPEQLQGLVSGRSSDIYSLGLICYDLLAAQHPLGTKYKPGKQELLETLSKESIRPPSVACAGAWRQMPSPIARSIDLVLMKALEMSPKLRYHAAADFLDALSRCLDGFGRIGSR